MAIYIYFECLLAVWLNAHIKAWIPTYVYCDQDLNNTAATSLSVNQTSILLLFNWVNLHTSSAYRTIYNSCFLGLPPRVSAHVRAFRDYHVTSTSASRLPTQGICSRTVICHTGIYPSHYYRFGTINSFDIYSETTNPGYLEAMGLPTRGICPHVCQTLVDICPYRYTFLLGGYHPGYLLRGFLVM